MVWPHPYACSPSVHAIETVGGKQPISMNNKNSVRSPSSAHDILYFKIVLKERETDL